MSNVRLDGEVVLMSRYIRLKKCQFIAYSKRVLEVGRHRERKHESLASC
jgi:hypothetical protein